MGVDIDKKGNYTKLSYFGYGRDIEWYISEPVFPGVKKCSAGELILNLPNKPNLVQLFPRGGFLKRIGEEFEVVSDQDTIDKILATFPE